MKEIMITLDPVTSSKNALLNWINEVTAIICSNPTFQLDHKKDIVMTLNAYTEALEMENSQTKVLT